MSLTRVKEKYQITIPAAIRKQLDLRVGDVLDAEIQDDAILLRPKALVDRSRAAREMEAVMKQIQQKNENIPEKEVVEGVPEAVQDVRARKHAHLRS